MSTNFFNNLDYYRIYQNFIPDLESYRINGDWIKCRSPLREDKNPSFGINLKDGGFIDHGTGAKGSVLDFLLCYGYPTKNEQMRFLKKYEKSTVTKTDPIAKPKGRLVSKTFIDIYTSNLIEGNYSEINPQLTNRKISIEICRKYRIGCHKKNIVDTTTGEIDYFETLFIPYKIDESGNCTEFKEIPYKDGKKITGFIFSKGSCQIFPNDMLDKKNLVICEGELDVLSLISQGINAITFTAGAGSIPKDVESSLKGKIITIIYDNDDAGIKGAEKVAKQLKGIADSIKIAQWDRNIDGYDVGEFFSEGRTVDELVNILNETKEIETSVQIDTDDNDIDGIKDAVELIKNEIYNNIYHISKNRVTLLTSALAEYLSQSSILHLISCQDDPSSAKRIFYMFWDGYWQVINQDFIKKYIIYHLSEPYTDYQVNQVLNILGTLVSINISKLNSYQDLINLKNGTYDLKNYLFMEHSSEQYFTYKNHYDYDPKAKCREFDRALENYSKDKFGNIDWQWIIGFWQVLGYCLTGAYVIHKMFWFFGLTGGEGKSTLCRVMSWLVGEFHTKPNLEPKQLSDPFYKGNLINKRLAIAGEIPPNIDNLEILKQLTGGDEQSTEVKFKESKNFKNSAKMVICMNKLPIFSSSTAIKPVLRRVYLLPFDNPLKEFNPDIEDKFKAELPGIFIQSIEGLKRLRKNHNKFTECQRATKLLTSYEKEVNMVAEFVEQYLIQEHDAYVLCHEITDEFKRFIETNTIGNTWQYDKSIPNNSRKLGIAMSSYINFVSETMYSPERGGTYSHYRGIRLMTEDEKRAKFSGNNDVCNDTNSLELS